MTEDNDNGDEEEGDESTIESAPSKSTASAASAQQRPTKSRLTSYVTQYLDEQNKQESKDDDGASTGGGEGAVDFSKGILKDLSLATHLIAIPMDTCNELLIELESVQRAILYHCPILVHSCIVGSNTKLPLLYVSSPDNLDPRKKSRNPIYTTSILGDAIRGLTQKYFYDTNQRAIAGRTSNDGSVNDKDGDDYDDVNDDGVKPFTMSFETLEIDGTNNNILHTVGKKDEYGTLLLREFVFELATTLIAKGWYVSLPNDPHRMDDQNENIDDDESSPLDAFSSYRPRVPFMELPKEMNDNIEKFKNTPSDELTEEDLQSLTSDQGGNGISPIFWAQWWDDTFGKNIRLPAIGIYPNQNLPQGIDGGAGKVDTSADDDSFWLQYESIELPKGNAEMQQSEAKFQKYQDDRIVEEQIKQEMEEEEEAKEDKGESDEAKKSERKNQILDMENDASTVSNDAESMDDETQADAIPEDDMMLTKTRERLEALYSRSSAAGDITDDEVVDTDIEIIDQQASSMDAAIDSDDGNGGEDADEGTTEDAEAVDGQSSSSKLTKKDGYIDDWTKQRIQKVVDRQKQLAAEKRKNMPTIESNPVFQKYKNGTLTPKLKSAHPTDADKEDLPPYPSREHFMGIWRVVSSPTGFASELPSKDSSENLILRADGTTAGGPILDQQLKQKAAGGTWAMVVDGDVVKLRIRLVIPPKRERILVMEGEVTRMDMTSDNAAPLTQTSKAFGIPELEEKAKQNYKDLEDLMHCGGEVRFH